MRPWIPVAITTAFLMALAGRYLWFWARRVVSFVADECAPSDALAAAAVVRNGTVIEVLERDARSVAEDGRWRRLLASWVRSGATLTYLVARKHDEGMRALMDIARGASRGTLKTFVMDENTLASALGADYGECHFAAFTNPDQLWLEGSHITGMSMPRDCEYVPLASRDERFEARRADFAKLLAGSSEFTGA